MKNFINSSDIQDYNYLLGEINKCKNGLSNHKSILKNKILGIIFFNQRGREIGFPTANILMEGWIEPLFGVYAVSAELNGLSYGGVANIGTRPTFGKSSPILEVHLFDYSGDLYGNDIIISFIDFIRKEKKFDGIDSLKKTNIS